MTARLIEPEAATLGVEGALARLGAELDASAQGAFSEVSHHVELAIRTALHQRNAVTGEPLHAATFGSVPVWPEGPMFEGFASQRSRAAGRGSPRARAFAALLDALELFQRALIFAADCQEYVDANQTSATYLRAAGHLDNAAASITGSERELLGV